MVRDIWCNPNRYCSGAAMSIEEPDRRFRKLGQYEQIPPMPSMIELLELMEGACAADPIIKAYALRSKETRYKIYEMGKKGMKPTEIVEIIGISKTQVYGYLREYRQLEAAEARA